MAAAQSHAEGSLAGQRGAHGTSAAQGGLRLRFGQKNWKRQTTESDDGLLDPRWHKASSPASTCARGRGGRGWGGSLGGPAREGPRPGPIPSRPARAGLLGAVPAAGGSKARCVSRCRRRASAFRASGLGVPVSPPPVRRGQGVSGSDNVEGSSGTGTEMFSTQVSECQEEGTEAFGGDVTARTAHDGPDEGMLVPAERVPITPGVAPPLWGRLPGRGGGRAQGSEEGAGGVGRMRRGSSGLVEFPLTERCC